MPSFFAWPYPSCKVDVHKSTDTNPADWSPCFFWSVSESVFPTGTSEGNIFDPHLKAIHAYLFSILFVHVWLCWVFVAALLSLAVASGGCSLIASTAPRCSGVSCHGAPLQSPGSVAAACRPSCPSARGIFPGWGSSLSPVLAGRFLTIGPREESLVFLFFSIIKKVK